MFGVDFAGVFTESVTKWGEALISKLPNLVLAIVAIVLFWLIAKLVRTALRRALDRLSDNRAVNRLLSTLSYLALVTVGLFIALGVLELDKTVTSLLAGAGIVGLALAFAFQDAVENLVSGVSLSIRRPFRVGDFIETNGEQGTVEDLSLRTTSLRRPEGQLVVMPNRMVFKTPLVNFTTAANRRVDVEVGVSYDDDLARVRRVASEAVGRVEGRDPGREVEVFFTGFGESSIDLVVRFWLSNVHPGHILSARSDAIERVKEAFDREGISIPFPVRALLGSPPVPPSN